MPAIDLNRLRKQASRLADFFFVPDEFIRHLREMLEFYVDHTMRKQPAIAPSADLLSYHMPAVILKQIEQEIHSNASEYPDAALELADRLWDEGYLETRLLAAFLLGRIPPQEERLLARLTGMDTANVRSEFAAPNCWITVWVACEKGNAGSIPRIDRTMASAGTDALVVERTASRHLRCF